MPNHKTQPTEDTIYINLQVLNCHTKNVITAIILVSKVSFTAIIVVSKVSFKHKNDRG